MTDDKSGKDARGGPMRIVYAVIILGIVAVVAGAFFTGSGPGGDAETTPPETSAPAPAN